MCIILKVDLGCCRGCRERICRSLMRIEGVKEVKVREDGASIVVCGEGFDEAGIVEQVKRRKNRFGVEVVGRLQHEKPASIDDSGHEANPQKIPSKPKYQPPPHVGATDAVGETGAGSAPPLGTVAIDALDNSGPMKGETLVTERIHKECEGTRIRTRVTTSRDVCTCILVEETRFIVDKQQSIRGISCTEIVVESGRSNLLMETQFV